MQAQVQILILISLVKALLLLIIDNLDKVSVLFLSVGSHIIYLFQPRIGPKLRRRRLSNAYVNVVRLLVMFILCTNCVGGVAEVVSFGYVGRYNFSLFNLDLHDNDDNVNTFTLNFC